MIHYFLALLLLFPVTIQAVIITVDQVQNTKMPELPTKKFILYGDCHSPSPEDKRQLEGLIQSLLKRDRESDEKIHFLIEKPAGLPYDSVLGCLYDKIRLTYLNNVFRNTTIENIEIRDKSKAIHSIFNPRNVFPVTYWSSYNYRGDLCKDVTIKDIEEEIARHRKDTDDWLVATPLQYTKGVREDEESYQEYLANFKKKLEAYSIEPEDNVMDIYERFKKYHPQRIEILFDVLQKLTTQLFDFHIAKCLITPRQAQTVALVAGAWHTMMAYGFLDRIGNRTIARYGTDSTYPTAKPLAVKYLDPDYSPCSCLSPCITFLDRQYSPCHCCPSCITQ
jgi:hypothetical protein